jgi:hypothetical protein
MRKPVALSTTLLLGSSVALADHVPGVGFDYKGTWIVVIAVGVIFSLLVLSALWAYLDGQFSNTERVKHLLTQPDEDWPYGRGTSIERPNPEKG